MNTQFIISAIIVAVFIITVSLISAVILFGDFIQGFIQGLCS